VKKKAVLIAAGREHANPDYSLVNIVPSPSLPIVALGSYLAFHEAPVELIDLQIDFGIGLTQTAAETVYRSVAQYLKERAHDIAWVGISQTSNIENGLALASEIHVALPHVPIVFGGYFPTTVYRRLLLEYPFIRAVVRGDGEAAALRISRVLDRGGSFPSDEIPNLAWLDHGEMRTTPVRTMSPEDLPILDFRLLRNPGSYPLAHLMSSRGCPYRCNYCLENTMRPYGAHSPDWLARQLDHLEATMRNKFVLFIDPIFGVNREETLELCRILRGRRFSYCIESRADVLQPDLIPVLHDSGVNMIIIGLESASPATLARMNKVRSQAAAESYVRKALEIVEACFENDVTPMISFMFSFPGDTEEDYKASLQFIQEVEGLHNRVTARTGIQTGYKTLVFATQVYEGSPLAERMPTVFPQVSLSNEWTIGARRVLVPSPGLDQDVTQRYMEQAGPRCRTTRAQERCPLAVPFAAFTKNHSEAADADGPLLIADRLFEDFTAFYSKCLPAPHKEARRAPAIMDRLKSWLRSRNLFSKSKGQS